jgi:hypothetical protein
MIKSTNQSTNQLINQSINQSNNQSNNQPIKRPINQSINQPTNRPGVLDGSWMNFLFQVLQACNKTNNHKTKRDGGYPA